MLKARAINTYEHRRLIAYQVKEVGFVNLYGICLVDGDSIVPYIILKDE